MTARAGTEADRWEMVYGNREAWPEVVDAATLHASGSWWSRDGILEAAGKLAAGGLTATEVVSGLAVVHQFSRHPREVAADMVSLFGWFGR